MNLLLVDHQDPDIDINSNGTIVVRGRRCKHLQQVLKINPNESIRAAYVDGQIGTATVNEISQREILLTLEDCEQLPAEPLNCHLVLALPRPQMFKRILQQCATLGVHSITLIHSSRVEKSFWQSPVLTQTSVREQLVLGAEQAVSTYLPEVQTFKKWREFVAEFQQKRWKACAKVVLHPLATQELEHHYSGDNALVIAIGPEGGFIPEEIIELNELGFSTRSMGKRILKVETAVVAALSKLF